MTTKPTILPSALSDATRKRGGLSAKGTPIAPTTAIGVFASSWQRERALRLHRIMLAVVRRIQAGQTLHVAITPAVWWNRNRTYTCDAARRLHFSRQTITAAYYQWCKNGRKPSAFALRFKSGPVLVKPAHVKIFLQRCLMSDETTFANAFRSVKHRAGSYRSYHRQLSPAQRKAFLALFRIRRQARIVWRAAAATLEVKP